MVSIILIPPFNFRFISTSLCFLLDSLAQPVTLAPRMRMFRQIVGLDLCGLDPIRPSCNLGVPALAIMDNNGFLSL